MEDISVYIAAVQELPLNVFTATSALDSCSLALYTIPNSPVLKRVTQCVLVSSGQNYVPSPIHSSIVISPLLISNFPLANSLKPYEGTLVQDMCEKVVDSLAGHGSPTMELLLLFFVYRRVPLTVRVVGSSLIRCFFFIWFIFHHGLCSVS